MKYAEYDSPVGRLLLTCEDCALTGLWLNRQPPATAKEGANDPVLRMAAEWLDGYFRGEPSLPDILLLAEGTEFQKLVWKLLLEIPFGQTRTYGQLAKEAAKIMGKERMSAQAIGGAVGRNPISILIPCHRVIGSDGKLTGYAGGLENKLWLLRHEGLEY